MTPELKLAQFLSSDEDKQKLASEMETLSVDDLEGILKEAVSSSQVRGAATGIALGGAGALAGHAALNGHVGNKAQNTMKGLHQAFHPSSEKTANGDMMAYFRDHPEKLKEKQERDAKKEKKASDSRTMTNESPETKVTHTLEKDKKVSTQDKLKMADAWGRELAQKEKAAFIPPSNPNGVRPLPSFMYKEKTKGNVYPKKEKKAGVVSTIKGLNGPVTKAGHKLYENRGKVIGTAGVLAGHKMGSNSEKIQRDSYYDPKSDSWKDKTDKSWDRKGNPKNSWAEKHAAGVIPGASLNKARDAVMGAAKRMGSGAHKAVSGAAKSLGAIKDPISRGAAIGAAAGGVGGAAQGFLDPKEDPMTGKKQRLTSAVRKGLGGAAAGGTSGALFGAMAKSSSVQKLAAAMEKRALGMAGIGSMAKNFVSQMKPVAQKAMTAAKPMVQGAMNAAKPLAQKAMGALKSPGVGQAAGMGAVAGGVAGAAKGLVAPGRDANGQAKGRISGAMSGAAGGAAMGAIGGGGGKALSAGMPLKR